MEVSVTIQTLAAGEFVSTSRACKRTVCSPACTKCCCTQKARKQFPTRRRAYVAASLINKGVEELDWVRLYQLFDVLAPPPNRVEEPRVPSGSGARIPRSSRLLRSKSATLRARQVPILGRVCDLQGELVYIVAIAHGSREPGYWKRRKIGS